MTLIPLQIPPGLYRNGTDFQASGRWRDANLVRWHDEVIRPVMGWVSRGSSQVSGVPRGAISWNDNSRNRKCAVGTHDGLYVMPAADTLTDITPVGLTTGRVSASQNTGYGGGTYGAGAYGVARDPSGIYQDATQWVLDTWGENLIAVSPDDGKIYEWGGAGVAAQISNAPTNCRAAFVSEERFLFALGADGNPRKLQWSDREDNTTWSPLPTNEAGDQELEGNGRLMNGFKTQGGSLILSDEDAYTVQYIGGVYVHGVQRAGTACGMVSNGAGASVDAGVFWMGQRSFYGYQGGRVAQIPCDVADYVFSGINRTQISKVFAVANTQWSEIWWFYPSDLSTENDRYVSFNYSTGVWATGSLERTAGVDRGAFNEPIWFDASGDIWRHETGNVYSGAVPFAETGPISLGNGDTTMTILDLIPDERTQGEVTATFKARYYPNGPEHSQGPLTMANPTSVRITGRQIRFRIDGAANDDWRVGIPRIDAQERGNR